jgi:hypothetical protein
VSVSQGGDVLVSAQGLSDTGLREGYFTYIFYDQGNTVDVIPSFNGEDWTSEDKILGGTNDDEILEFNPFDESVDILFMKGATSPDWSN